MRISFLSSVFQPRMRKFLLALDHQSAKKDWPAQISVRCFTCRDSHLYCGGALSKPGVEDPGGSRVAEEPHPVFITGPGRGSRKLSHKCVQCHGETGKGDGPDAAMYYPSPASLTDGKRMNTATNGELFYEISEGRKPMPSFKKRLTEEQRWQLVLLVRSFVSCDSSNH